MRGVSRTHEHGDVVTLLLPVFLAVLASGHSQATQPLAVVNNERLTFILTNFQLLAATSTSESKQFFVRVLAVTDHGECGDAPASCPKSALFIAVSSFDEYPDQRV